MSANSRKSASSTLSGRMKKNATRRIRSFMHKKTSEIFLQNQALINYVTNQEYAANKKIIERFCKKQPSQTITLYRGHMKSTEIRKNIWFSTSKSKSVAKDEFSGKDCCVFTIHIIDVPILDVNKHVGGKIGKYAEEEEAIVLGGGTFYKNKYLTEPGFNDIGNGEFVCWYTIPQKTKKKGVNNGQEIIKSFFDQIPEEEYDFIDSPSDIVIRGITESQRKQVFEEIEKMKLLSGSKGRGTSSPLNYTLKN